MTHNKCTVSDNTTSLMKRKHTQRISSSKLLTNTVYTQKREYLCVFYSNIFNLCSGDGAKWKVIALRRKNPPLANIYFWNKRVKKSSTRRREGRRVKFHFISGVDSAIVKERCVMLFLKITLTWSDKGWGKKRK